MSKKLDLQAKIKGFIEKEHWMVQGVMRGDDKTPAFYYSIGMAALGLPEVLIIGDVPMETARQLINDIGEMYRKEGVVLGQCDRIIRNFPVHLIPVKGEAVERDWCIQAQRYYAKYPGDRKPTARDFNYVQMVFPDSNGKFPWMEGYNTRFQQPVLGTYTPH